jgi:SH3-like domain-containing protein
MSIPSRAPWRLIVRCVLAALLMAAHAVITPGFAQDADTSKVLGPSTNLPLPRFVSLKKDKVFMRRGPGEDHAIEWVYVRRHLPVEIVNEYQLWREVRDSDGAEGWISATMLSGERYVIVRGQAGKKDASTALHSRPDAKSGIVALAQPGVIAVLRHCPDQWCEIEADSHTGWVERASLWGILDNERIE